MKAAALADHGLRSSTSAANSGPETESTLMPRELASGSHGGSPDDTSSGVALIRAAFPGLTAAACADLLAAFASRRAAKGAVLVRQGTIFGDTIIVRSGVLRLYITRPDGREFNKNFFAEQGLVLPLTASMASGPSPFSVAALESSVLHVARHDAVVEVLQHHGLWHTVQRKLLAGMVNHKLQREYELLALSGRERYEKFCAESPQLARRLPIGQIASYLGLTDVSLSRIRTATGTRPAQ